MGEWESERVKDKKKTVFFVSLSPSHPLTLSLSSALAAALLCLLGASPAVRAESIWVEGEKPSKSDFIRHNWYDKVNKSVLSGQEWLSHYGGRAGEATYAIDVKKPGPYTFWIRCNNFKVTQHYRIDGGAWVLCDLAKDPRGRMMISPRPDHRFIAWVKLGRLRLARGRHRVSFRLSNARLSNHGGIDCFVLIDTPWVPAGATRPADTDKPAGPADWFAVMPDNDEFSPKSVIDLTHLIPAPAGKFGFVTSTGNQLTVGGKPVKFWGCGGNIDPGRPRADQTRRIKYLVKHGVNMIRQHPLQQHLGLLRSDGTFDPKKLDPWDWWFAELKKHGIYMTWSLFYPHHITAAEGYDLFDELPKARWWSRDKQARSTSGLVNIEPALQASEWRWAKAILTHRNKYTGLRYVDDPALAVVEVHNEDSVFWHWPLNYLEAGKKYPRHTARLKDRWAEWLRKRYLSDSRWRAAWGRGMRPGDSLTNANMGIYGAWEMNADGPQRNKAEKERMGDFIRFLAELQRGYYEKRMKQLAGIGFKATTISTAWRAGGAAADPANLWCDSAAGMISRHNYFGGGDGRHNVTEGKVDNRTHLGMPGEFLLAIGMYQLEDRPFAVTEWTSMTPNQYKLEAAPLLAFYGMGLQGWDASYHFLNGRSRIGSGWPNMRAYVTDTPHYIGQFPALAFAIYKGHIREAAIVAGRRVKVDDLFQGIDPLQQDFTGGGYDDKELKGNLATPAEVLAVGRVTTKFARRVKASSKVDWTKHWNKGRKVITSTTGELTWDYGRRVVTVQTSKTQAVLGFAKGQTFKLPGVTVKEIKTPFISLIFTPLDDQPLSRSKNILITAMAKDKQTGTEYSADGKRLIKGGLPPLLMEPVQATISLKGRALKSVKVLDIYGVPTGKTVKKTRNTFTIDGRYKSYYYQVTR